MKLVLPCVLALVAGACVVTERGQGPGARGGGGLPQVCVDRDKDGFGDSCAAGPDCDDSDPSIHQGCLRCATPSQGCECTRGTRPTQCFVDKTTDDSGKVMCNEGTRYCRDGKWSGCESIFSYPKPDHLPSRQ